MFLKMRNITFVLLFALSLGACSEYQKVLKEDDIKAKYVMADSLYNQGKKQGKKGKLKKSLRLLDQIVPQYRGKPQGERLAYIYADTYYQLGSYFDSGYQFERFTKAYPRSEKAEEAYYKGAESYYEVSPRYSLDQTETHKAIDKFQQYISRYPDGEYIGEANELVGDLRDKLDKKQYEIAKQYHHTEDYKAAIAAFNNFIEDNPGSKYIEKAYFYKLDAAYTLAINSYRQLVPARLKEAKEYYGDYFKYYPDGEFSTRAGEISTDIENRLQNINNSNS
ncbi:MAG: outer membrane protein assembly factor BamD [Mesonia sp.]|uniref:Outer membrane protein assembly factor BamD n=1 Tax=Mesonia oceanica TaxID=2687242 RepID=A0AC61YC45_9FLAO|nr:outer membrane protein assembly factor BamD [Mesonia sp.]MAQ39893.1 outer membrane protein assembly factor BamD [Mesonia sp.]MBJ99027.1 outer membrane protein assembly factor BamD [Flavobacteriaceae bacterium]VVV02062.1 Outer membrane protein assembly factor BamD [Mesonia oceanica]|tara:strand:- start:9830 stop:10666 length:837 start_codon:yes stop_codon:yes gene_type:complete